MFKMRDFALGLTAGHSTAAASLSSQSILPIGDIQFYDNFLPALKDGTYTISVQPTLQDVPDNDVGPISQTFLVDGPRFSVDAQDIHAFFPSPNSSGSYGTLLPSVIFNKRTLPWERAFVSNATPWLALITVDESEFSKIQLTTTTVSTWLNDSTAIVPKLNIRTEEGSLSAQILSIDAKLFSELRPSLEELPYLAHCRQINTGDREILNIKDDGWFSVSVGNRFPRVPQTGSQSHVVHLVSLEGFEDYLAWTDPLRAAIAANQNLRIASLAHWNFNCLPDPKEDFNALMVAVVEDELNNPLLALPKPIDDGSAEASLSAQQFAKGYVPCAYRLRSGEQSFAWYRGPLTPINFAARSDGLLATSLTGDKLRIYNQDEGNFDLSYATAFQLGRSLALADKKFTETLMALRLTLAQSQQQKFRQQEFINSLKTTNPSLVLNTNADLKTQILYAFTHSLSQANLGDDFSMTTKPVAAPKNAYFKPSSALERYNQRRTALAATASDSPDVPQSLITWVKDRILFKYIPFEYLIADANLLPKESLRFFYVDPNWINTFIDGAFSLGLSSDKAKSLNETIKAQVKTAIGNYPLSGFLFRSQVVSSWPALGVRTDTSISILRQERLSKEVLLCLFSGYPSQLTLAEPQEQLNFGVEGDLLKDSFIALRTINPTYDEKSEIVRSAGAPMIGTNIHNLPSYLRPLSDPRVLNIASPQVAQPETIAFKYLLPAFENVFKKTLSPSEYALQMMKAPLAARFK